MRERIAVAETLGESEVDQLRAYNSARATACARACRSAAGRRAAERL